MDEIREAINELMTQTYRLGMVVASGQEYFANGELYTRDDIMKLHQDAADKLEALLSKDRTHQNHALS